MRLNLRRRRASESKQAPADLSLGHVVAPGPLFASTWAWAAPLGGAAAVFTAVMCTTPPGFAAISDVVSGTPRGTNADSVAYVLGSAASLALLALVVLLLVAVGTEFVLRHRKSVRRP
jgi:hypothetical protein